MISQGYMKPHALNPVRDEIEPQPELAALERDERDLGPQRLGFESPGAELVDADTVLLGLQIGNIILAAGLGLLTRTER